MPNFRSNDVMEILDKHHTSISKQTTLLAGVDPAPPNGVA